MLFSSGPENFRGLDRNHRLNNFFLPAEIVSCNPSLGFRPDLEAFTARCNLFPFGNANPSSILVYLMFTVSCNLPVVSGFFSFFLFGCFPDVFLFILIYFNLFILYSCTHTHTHPSYTTTLPLLFAFLFCCNLNPR